MVEPSFLRSGTDPVKSHFKLVLGKMLFFRSSKWSDEASEPLDPFLVADKSSSVDTFILSETKLEVFFSRFKISIKIKAHKLTNQADFFAGLQALLDRIEESLVFLPGDFTTETHCQAGCGGL